jgi:phenylalanyl-tRNA synthetase beta chain
MKISLGWLGRYVDLDDLAPERIRDDLTMSTAEIEDLSVFGAGLDDLVIGHVVACSKHPGADKLSLTKVDVGAGECLPVVCGAPNVAAGQRVVVAPVGATLPGGVKIGKTRIRGELSAGMICSERELGLSDDHAGIMLLDGGLRAGARFVDAVPVVDHVLEIDNKSINHRPDLWGHLGFARELAAIFDRPLRSPLAELVLPAKGRSVPIAIEDQGDCPRFTGVVIEGARALRSPAWLRWRLQACGMRAINLLVDLTNFVMLELGQPMHAFDLRRIAADGILVRRARAGETLVTLDGNERRLVDGDLLVTSGGAAVALAGVMGGEGTMVEDDTTELLLESANFRAARIRRTSARLGLRTDASTRFEKALDPSFASQGAHRFLALLGELCPGARAAGPLVDPAGWRYQPRRIRLRKARLDLKLGIELPGARVASILRGLEFGVREDGADFDVAVPSFRATKDITIEDDLIEEVGRMFRYDNIPEQPLRSVVAVPPREPELYLAREILRIGATDLACHEVFHYSFVADALVEAVGAVEHRYARVRNPVAPELGRVRRHVLPSLLGALEGNLRTESEVRLMELGKGYLPEARGADGLPREVMEIGFAWSTRGAAHPVGALRSALESLLGRIARPARIEQRGAPADQPWFHPGRTVVVAHGDTAVGHVGPLHPAVARRLGVEATTAMAFLDLRALLASGRTDKKLVPMPRFPAQPVDVALLADEATRVATIADFLRAAGGALVRGVVLFEVYRGGNLPAGRKSLNFTVTLGADDRTLTAADEERYLGAVREGAPALGAELRG